MSKYGSGVEMSDVLAMMGAIEAMHECRTVFHITTHGQGHNGRGRIELCATFTTLPDSDLPKQVSVEHVWPTRAAGTLPALLYNLVWQLDYAIQQAYEQLPLKEI